MDMFSLNYKFNTNHPNGKAMHFDEVTQLPHKYHFYLYLQQVVQECLQKGAQLAVFAVSVEDFENFYETLGFDAGETILKEVAQRLNRFLKGCMVSRNGEEFLIVIKPIKGYIMAEKIAHELIAMLSEPLQANDLEIYAGFNVGISCFPLDGKDSDSLIRNARTALSGAKEKGRDRVDFYTPALNKRKFRDLSLKNDLYRALKSGEFFLHYQPQVDHRSRQIIGAEALLRWNHPTKGMISPEVFIPLAEECGLIVKIGEWVLREACRQIREWEEKGLKEIKVAVNLSPAQLFHGNFLHILKSALQEYNIGPGCLELEIVESISLLNRVESVSMLRSITDMGVSLALDDFGTGYCSLMYLKEFPVRVLKIGRPFITDLGKEVSNDAIVHSIIKLALNLNMEVVAEGVESLDQLNRLLSWGCSIIQGYLFSRPVPANTFYELISGPIKTFP